MSALTPGQKVLVEIHSPVLSVCEWLPGVFEGYISATDRDHRLNVKMDNGWYISGAAPECVKPIS